MARLVSISVPVPGPKFTSGGIRVHTPVSSSRFSQYVFTPEEWWNCLGGGISASSGPTSAPRVGGSPGAVGDGGGERRMRTTPLVSGGGRIDEEPGRVDRGLGSYRGIPKRGLRRVS